MPLTQQAWYGGSVGCPQTYSLHDHSTQPSCCVIEAASGRGSVGEDASEQATMAAHTSSDPAVT